jgi:hypothetical protein
MTTDRGFLSYAANNGKVVADPYSVYFWMRNRQYADPTWLAAMARMSKACCASGMINPFMYLYAIAFESYREALDAQKKENCLGEENFAEDILDPIIRRWFSENNIGKYLSLEYLPELNTGNEALLKEVYTKILEHRKQLLSQKNHVKSVMSLLRRHSKKLLKYILPYGFVRLWQKIHH